MGEMNRTASIHPQPGGFAESQPTIATLQCDVVPFAGWLTDRPDHAEVSNRGSASSLASLERRHTMPALDRRIGVSQSHDARTNDGNVQWFSHGIATSAACPTHEPK
jgi:hypothetical protein